MTEANFTGAFLDEANLTRANLSETNLTGSVLKGANLKEAKTFHTIFAYGDLTDTLGLDKCDHLGPSIIDHRMLQQSKNIPVEFLRCLGLQDWQIEDSKLLKPNLSNPEINDIIYRVYDLRAHLVVQINPLFISYSNADAHFANAIEKKLTEKGVHYWRDINKMTAGRMERQVDRAMRLNDTVLLVLSENSVNSDWVVHEAASAREIEKERGKDVLCPVALDDSWKDCDWDMKLRRQVQKYNILDFSKWQDEEVFNKQFGKLLDGLEIFYKEKE